MADEEEIGEGRPQKNPTIALHVIISLAGISRRRGRTTL